MTSIVGYIDRENGITYLGGDSLASNSYYKEVIKQRKVFKSNDSKNMIIGFSGALRDLDLLKKINEKSKCVVQMTLTTHDEELCKIIEPNVSTTKERYEVLKIMHEAGIPTIVWLCPILPYINDTEENIRGILNYSTKAKVYGIICFGMGLTLREGNREYFYQKLGEHFPGMKEKYISKYGNAYEIHSPNNAKLMKILKETCTAHHIHDTNACFQYLRQYEAKNQYEQITFPGFDDIL